MSISNSTDCIVLRICYVIIAPFACLDFYQILCDSLVIMALLTNDVKSSLELEFVLELCL